MSRRQSDIGDRQCRQYRLHGLFLTSGERCWSADDVPRAASPIMNPGTANSKAGLYGSSQCAQQNRTSIKKGGRVGRLSFSSRKKEIGSDDLQIRSGYLASLGRALITDFLPIGQRAESGPLDCADVHKNILVPVIGCDKPKTSFRVEEFYCSSSHGWPPIIQIATHISGVDTNNLFVIWCLDLGVRERTGRVKVGQTVDRSQMLRVETTKSKDTLGNIRYLR